MALTSFLGKEAINVLYRQFYDSTRKIISKAVTTNYAFSESRYADIKKDYPDKELEVVVVDDEDHSDIKKPFFLGNNDNICFNFEKQDQVSIMVS